MGEIDRRQFLRGVGAVGMGTAVAGRALGAPASPASLKAAYRLSVRNHACNACKGTAANRYYRTFDLADQGRAHLGCNCRVLTQLMPTFRWRRLFVRFDRTLRDVYDTRWRKGV